MKTVHSLATLLLLFTGALAISLEHLRDGEDVYLTETTPRILARDSEDFPEFLHFRLRRKDNDLTLRLRRNNMENENADVYVIRTGDNGEDSIVKENLKQKTNYGLYQDREVHGSFTVRCKTNNNGRCQKSVLGTMYVDGAPHTLRPDDVTQTRGTDDVSGYRYILKRTPLPNHKRSRPVRIPGIPVQQSNYSSQWNIYTNPGGGKSYGVELLAVVDYEIYKNADKIIKKQQQPLYSIPLYNGDYNYYVNQGNRETTLGEIRQYFAHIVNGMDLRYGNIEADDFNIYIKLAGLIIADTPEKSKWTVSRAKSGAQYGSKRNVIDSNPTLGDFKNWIQNTPNLPNADHAMLFTGYDLISDGSTGTLGIAYMNGVCGDWMTSLVEAHGDMMSTIETATHELGHNLGASHDGTKNKCKSSDQYIMASYAGTRYKHNELNPWKWTSCSVEYFRKFLKGLEKKRDNCLENEATHGNEYAFYYHTRRLPGQMYSLEEQCKLNEGETSYPCYEKFMMNEVCQKLYCSKSAGSCKKHLASRGTSCGNRQWCLDGACQYDEQAPASNYYYYY